MSSRLLNKIKARKIILALVGCFAISFLLPVIAQAQNLTLESVSGPFGSVSLAGFIAGLIRVFLGVVGVILMVIFMYAGFTWTTAGGDPAKIDKAKKIMAGALIGLILTVSAFGIASFLVNAFNLNGPGPGEGCEPGTVETCVVGEYCPGTSVCNDLGMSGICIKDDPGCGSGDDGDDTWYDIISSSSPVITYISPAKDTEGNNPAYGFLGKAANDDIANGASGNYITISGRRFGNTTGTVVFKNVSDNTTTSAPLADCANSWRSNQIIVEVPPGLDISDVDYEDISSTTATNYQVTVVTAAIPETATASATPSKISNYKGFLVNDVVRPGICSAVPSSGIYPATTTISGNNFPTSGTQNVVWSMRYFDFVSSTWRDDNITSTASNWTAIRTIETLPENKKGRSSFRIYNGSEYSNYYAFLLSAGRLGDPCGYDSNACNEDVDTCVAAGLECQFCQKTSSTLPYYDENCNPAKNCTCQSEVTAVCENGEEETCSVGGCSGKSLCVNGQWSACVADPGCISYLGTSTSTLAVFTWPFIARKNPAPGMDCSSALWNDGTCDLNGCISKDLFCKTEGSDQGFVEVYNPTNEIKETFLCSVVWSKKAKDLDRHTVIIFNSDSITEKADGSIRMSGFDGSINENTKISSEELILSPGNYSLFIRLRAENSSSDSFIYKIPGMSFFAEKEVSNKGDFWQWQKIPFSLSQETSGRVEIGWRETKFFDHLFLSKGDCFQKNVTANNFGVFDLPINDHTQLLLAGVNNGELLDSYLVSTTSSAFYPYSFGRVADGDKGSFVYFSSSTPGASNGLVASEENLSDKPIINEVSLSSDPCTCIQKGNFCKPGEVDRKSCRKISNCSYVRVCDANGYFGACIKADPSCIDYPTQATSTLSIFTWAFLASAVPPADAFKVVVDCSRSPQCLDSDMLPSPTPWPNEWNTSTHPNLAVEESLACTNSVISARFTMPISSPTLNSSTLKIFKQAEVNWTEQVITDDQIEKFTSLGEGGSDTFQISNFGLAAGAKYRVLISRDVLSETGSNLIRDNKVVNAEDCASTSAIMVSSSVAFCWNVEVRPSTDPCPVGCINCSPKNYFNRYFGQKRIHRASPISEDNVCLMLQESNYDWDWYERHRWLIFWATGTPETAYSAVLDLNGNETTIYDQSSTTAISGRATTTAKRESGWRNYVNDIISYFKDGIDWHFFKITVKETSSGHFGACPAHNDFSSPVVVENQYCTNDEDATKRILQSPSPWKGQQDACTNAVVFALFNRNMVDSSITSTDNIIVQKCDPGKATSTSIGDCTNVNTSAWTRNNFSYSHPDLTLQELMLASVDTDDTTKPDGIRLIPPSNFLFDQNSWYRVIIKGGNYGVRGAITTAGVETADGTLLTPTIPGTSYFSNGRDDYFWYFKTGTAECPIENVAVLPQLRFLRYVGLTQTYNADPQAANCNHLNPARYTWDWRSLISLNDENVTCNANTGDVIAPICNEEDATCNSTNQDTSYISKAFAKEEGQVKIKARAEDTAPADSTSCLDDKYGYGTLQIGYGGFRIVGYGNTDCLNSDIYFNFSSDGKGESITYGDLISNTAKNVGLYKCDDNSEECADMTAEAFSVIRPQNSGTVNSNPYLTGNVILRADLSTSTYYRVIVRGGVGGIKSFADSNLEGLNYSIYPNSGGEACDPSVYPWRSGDPDAGKCDNATCKFVATSNLCGTISEECKLGSPYCSSLCQKIGNTNIASCGNGKVEPGEDCDDGKIQTQKAQDGLIGYWKLDNHLKDLSGNGFDAVAVGGLDCTNDEGRLGNGCVFEIDKYLNISSVGAKVNPKSGSISAWAKPTATGTNTYVIDGMGSGTDRYYIQWTEGGFRVVRGNPASSITLNTNADLNEWYHLVMTWDEDKIYGYVNGELKDSIDYNSAFGAPTRFRIGDQDDKDKTFPGAIDEVSFFNRKLSDQEIKNLYTDFNTNKSEWDGCSNICLWEGSNGRSSRCKNGKVDYGEQCDFGSASNNTTKGCDPDTCLWVSGYDIISGNSKVCTSTDPGCNSSSLHTGSPVNVPVCGNGKIESGEQCDDGLNNGDAATARCSLSCLLSGSSGTDSTCNNGKLENGQHDSFSWVFRLSDSAAFCEDSIIEANPCPNGIWRFKASSNVASYTVKMYEGQESDGTGCIENSEIGFWRRIWNTLANAVRRVFGFRPVVAANYWCPRSEQSYSLSDLSAMDKGNYKRDFYIGSSPTAPPSTNAEALAYSIENNFRVINYIPSQNLNANSEYLAVTTYTTINGMNGTTTAKVNTYGAVCPMRKIDVEVWPKGLVKQSDGFFCYSDPDSGKPDECGRYSDDPYDDDMSAIWTKDKDNSGYDLRVDVSVSDSSAYKKGNQHLYRYWALGDKSGGNGNWPLRAEFEAKVFNINTRTVVEDFSSSTYSGDSWVTSGANPGKTILNLVASDTVSGGSASSTSKDFPIVTYFCNNPWPDARNFPFLDNSNNCTSGSGTCHNTNFGTYYCRDAGVAKACVSGANKGKSCNSNSDCGGAEGSCQIFADDDLPSISKYDGLTGKLQGGIATGLTGDDCQNLPANFVPAMGVYYANGEDANWGDRLYLWSTGGDLYSYNSYENQGWKRVDKGYWQQQGLPNGFKPVVGYSYDNKLELWNDRGVCKVYNGDRWNDCIKTGLPNGFVPKVGYKSYGNNDNIQLWDASGNYYMRLFGGESSVWENKNYARPNYNGTGGLGINDVSGAFKPIAGYSSLTSIQLWDSYGNYIVFATNWENANGGRPATSTNFKPTLGYYDGSTVQLWNNKRNFYYQAGWIENKNIFDKTCDNKVKEFLFGRVGNLAEGSRYDFSATSTFSVLESFCDIDYPETCYNPSSNPNSTKDFSNNYDGSVSNSWDSIFTFNVNVLKPGKYYLLVETSNKDDGIKNIPPDSNARLWNVVDDTFVQNGCNVSNGSIYQRIGFYFDDGLLATTSVLASPPQDRQITKIDQPITINQPGNHKIKLYWDNDCSGSVVLNGENNDFDSNLRVYKISLVNMDAADTLDAVGIRVYANNNHYAPDKWYSDRFRLQFAGEKMIVDGYEAVNEGRTVYVGGGDLGDTSSDGPTAASPQSIFSNIYLMSFSQGASQALQNVFKQMVNNWFFNSGNMASGGLEYAVALGLCEGESIDDDNYCLTDIDCLKRGKSNCAAYKAKLIRDTKRLADLQNIASQLLRFYSASRCSNDFARSCRTNSDCYGGGTCGNYYPALKAGTYIPGKTFSVWPSWQDELGKSLSMTLPTDPINKFVGCSSPYDSTTCWNQETKKMFCSPAATSAAYSYYSWDGGKHYQLMAKGEFSNNVSLLWRPDWNKVNNLRTDPFSAYSSGLSNFCKSFPEMFSICQVNSGACDSALESCGNGVIDAGENCSNCWADAGCGYGNTCKQESGNYVCKPQK